MLITWRDFFCYPSQPPLRHMGKKQKIFLPFDLQTATHRWRVREPDAAEMQHPWSFACSNSVGTIKLNTAQLAATGYFVFGFLSLRAKVRSGVSAVCRHDHRHHPGLMPSMPSHCEIFRRVLVGPCLHLNQLQPLDVHFSPMRFVSSEPYDLLKDLLSTVTMICSIFPSQLLPKNISGILGVQIP